MNKKNLFKLYKYCINFYCHRYHNDIYLTNNEWLKIFSSKKYYNQLQKKIQKKDIFLSSTNYVDDCFFLSINYDINRFKQILKLLQDNNIFYEFNITECIIQFPVSLSFNKFIVAAADCKMSINEKELLQLIKNNNNIYNQEYIYNQAKVILDYHDYYTAYFYYGKFLKAYVQYMQNIRAPYKSINRAYNQFFSLQNNYKQYKLDNDMLSYLFNNLFIDVLANNTIPTTIMLSLTRLIINFAENLNIYFAININKQCITNIYNYIYKNYITQPLTPYNMYFTMSSINKLNELLNFNKEQKKNIKNFINEVQAKYLLMQL